MRTGLGADALSTAKRMDMSVEVPMQHMSELSKPNTWSERLQNKVRSAVFCCRKKNSCSSYGPKSPTHNLCYSVAPSFRSLLLRVWRLNCSSASCRELRVSCSCGLAPCASKPSCSEHFPVQKRFKKKESLAVMLAATTATCKVRGGIVLWRAGSHVRSF